MKSSTPSTSLLGSDFIMEDMLRELPGENPYRRLGDERAQGELCYAVEARPKDDDSHYTRHVLSISQADHRVLRIDFYRSEEQPEKLCSPPSATDRATWRGRPGAPNARS